MANLGAWQAPFPLRLGGGAHERAQRIFDEICANVPGLLSTATDSLNRAEYIAAARLVAAADRFIDRRVNQADPMKLSPEMVERWETILAITPDHGATLYDRRRAIAARTARNTETFRGDVDKAVADVFAPWKTYLHFTTLTGAVLWWPGGSSTTDLFWYSTIANVAIEYVVSASATQLEIDRRVIACADALDEMLPAWATFCFSQTPDFGATANLYGFYLDRPNLDVAALT